MRRIVTTGIVIFLLFSLITITGGCKSREGVEVTDKHHIVTVDSTNKELYEQIVFLQNADDALTAYENKPSGYPSNICSSMAMQMEKYKTEPDRRYHVVIDNLGEEMSVELIDEINKENGLSLNIDNWEKVYWGGCLLRYYYLLTAEEIWALADKGVYLHYVGTGVGDIKDANWDTEEGKEVYCQLYGDQVIHYEKGMTLYYEPVHMLGDEE